MGLSLTNFFVLARDNNTHAPEEWDYSEARPAALRMHQARAESGLHRRYRANNPDISGVWYKARADGPRELCGDRREFTSWW